MSATRTPFPPVFWVANLIEVLERFAYYGIYFGFGIYMTSLGYSRDQLGVRAEHLPAALLPDPGGLRHLRRPLTASRRS